MHKVWTLEHQIITSSQSKDNEEINSITFVLVVKPQALDQSKRVRAKQYKSWLSELVTSSNVRRPSPFHQLKSTSATFPKITQEIPKAWKTQFQKIPATGQCNRRWSTVSPLHWHIQHQRVKVFLHLKRLSQVKTSFQAAVQTKKRTLQGALVRQILFQEKTTLEELRNAS